MSIKAPDEFSFNICWCVQLKENKQLGIESYDFNMFMQEYLPITLSGSLVDHVVSVLSYVLF